MEESEEQMAENRRYYWLKLKEDFFIDKRIKKLRRISGGDTYTIIYLKLLLLSLKDSGKLYYDGVETDFIKELALTIDETEDDVMVTEEQNTLKDEIVELEEVTEKLQSVSDNTEQFIKTIKSFTDFSILTTSMINQLIDRIVIFQKQKLKRYKFTQRIDIYFNFIGKFEIEKEDEIKEIEYIEETEDKKYIHKDSRFFPIINYLKEQGREVELEFSKV